VGRYQRAVWLGFDDLARVPLLLSDPAGTGSGEPEHDVEVSIAPDRAEGFRHVIPGPEAGRAAEALLRFHHRAHPLDLEQPDVVSQVAMANQAWPTEGLQPRARRENYGPADGPNRQLEIRKLFPARSLSPDAIRQTMGSGEGAQF
jgi:hypothetical protein